ncbi:heparan-alpha-glucosaminide N-acetyltransferase domain-containing protein [Sinomicrobium sp. M5D2P17]
MEHQDKRILALDIIKGMSVIGMIIIHTSLTYADVAVQSGSIAGNFIVFLGRGTSVFLVCMGVTFMTSRHQSLKSALKRGCLLLGIALLMNFTKFIIPVWFDFAPDNFIQRYGWDAPIQVQYIYLVLLGDILQLAGMSLLVIGFIRRFVQNKYAILLIGLSVAVLSRELSGINIDIPVLNYILDLLFSNDFPAFVYFPVFPWMSFIIFGMFFGKWYVELNYDKKSLFKHMLWAGALFIAIGAPLVFLYEEYNYNDFYHMGPGGVIYFGGWTLVFLWIIHKLFLKSGNNICIRIVQYSSKNLTSLYVIQWVLISWGKGVFGYRQNQMLTVFILIIFFIILTFSVQFLIDFIKGEKQGLPTIKRTI